MTASEMWDMKLLDKIKATDSLGLDWYITRVPGGWIMREAEIPTPAYVFVPLDNEMVERENREYWSKVTRDNF